MNIKDLIPWNDNDKLLTETPFSTLERDMNRLFRDFSRTFFDRSLFRSDLISSARVMPSVDVAETDDEVKVTAELPGMDEKDIDVSLSKNILTLKGEKKQEKEEKDKNYYRMERSYGKFQRDIVLPEGIEQDKVDAKFHNGVLTVVLKKTPEAKKDVKKIEVKAE
ncbi:MAG: Hsp20/alpha crystallin family protein [Nitrospinaceae bacterium]